MNDIKSILGDIKGLDLESMRMAQEELDSKMKPQGSLGVLEKVVVKMAGIYGYPIEKIDKKCHIVASADNGVVEEDVSSCPVEYTRIVSEAMLNKIACIGIFTRRLGIEFNLIDIGMKTPIPKAYGNLYEKNIKRGTENFYKMPAMSRVQCIRAIEVGIDIIAEKSDGVTVFSNGEMGIGNTTTSSAILYSFTKFNLDKIVGRGGGLSDLALIKKKTVIKEACNRYDTFNMEPIDVISYVGGLDIACMVGMYLGAVKHRKLMLVDGFISAVAAFTAYRIEPKVKDFILFTHVSEEPGMKVILDLFEEKAFLNLNMRLGEGTGAVLAYPILDCALDMLNRMKTPTVVYNLFK